MTKAALIAGIAAAVSYASCAQAALYKCTGADGKVAYQDAPCPTNASELTLKAKTPPPPAAAAKTAPAGGKTASTSKVDTATAAKAAKTSEGKTKDPAPASKPLPDATKSPAPPGK